MTDLTPLLASLLSARKTHLPTTRRKQSDITDEFLKEAYRINAHISSLHSYLLRIRQPYLSTTTTHHRPSSYSQSQSKSHLTNPQRDRIDQESKSLLRDLQFSIQQLSAAAALRHDAQLRLARRNHGHGAGGVLRRWANGGRNPVEDGASGAEGEEEEKLSVAKTWRESVLWYLGRALAAAGEVQRGMMERRLEREVERSRSVLYMSRGSGIGSGGSNSTRRGDSGEEDQNAKPTTSKTLVLTTTTTTTTPTEPRTHQPLPFSSSESSSPSASDPTLTPAQLQLFATENKAMLKNYEDTLDQVRTAESSLLEISSLQTQLSDSLDAQSAHIDQLVADAGSITTDVHQGNTELKRAGERGSVARTVFWATCGLSLGLVLWDLVF